MSSWWQGKKEIEWIDRLVKALYKEYFPCCSDGDEKAKTIISTENIAELMVKLIEDRRLEDIEVLYGGISSVFKYDLNKLRTGTGESLLMAVVREQALDTLLFFSKHALEQDYKHLYKEDALYLAIKSGWVAGVEILLKSFQMQYPLRYHWEDTHKVAESVADRHPEILRMVTQKRKDEPIDPYPTGVMANEMLKAVRECEKVAKEAKGWAKAAFAIAATAAVIGGSLLAWKTYASSGDGSEEETANVCTDVSHSVFHPPADNYKTPLNI